MASTFGDYSVAYSGMYVNQIGLATTSTNISNVDTTGASRVRVASVEQSTTLSSGTSQGSGVSAASITRARDQYLDSTYRTQNSKNSYLSVKSGNLEYSDQILSEFDSTTSTTKTGVQAAVNDFFNAWQTLSTDSTTTSTRQAVVTAGMSLISTLTDIDGQLAKELQADAVTGVNDGVKSLNDLAGQVATLNQQITKEESNGSEASYLRDQRDSLLDSMSSLADISTSESNGTFQVTVGGTTLVNGGTAKTLTVEGSGTAADPLTIEMDPGKTQIAISSGSIGAYTEEADQTGYQTIAGSSLPYDLSTRTGISSISTLRQSLNDLITTVAVKVNDLSTSGVDLNGDAGVAFFTATDSTQPISLTNIEVNSALVEDASKVVTATSGNASGDNTVASDIYALATDTTCYKSDGVALDVTDFYKAVTSWIGTAGDTASSNYSTQTALVSQVDSQRQSVSSISIDEEMSNMMKYENAYAPNAKMLSTMDTLIEGIIKDL